jgi:Na+/melibiose symporter-like transporter
MIITARKRISFLWIVLATLPWVAVIFKDKVMGIAFTYSMRKFVENPAALSFLLTVPWYISWIVPPIVNFIADRIWTRWGRRKPFIVISWTGTIISIGLMPLAPSFGWLLLAYICFSIFNDLGGPVESLKMEIVPPAQRAASAAVMSWIGQVAVLVFWVVAIGRFHEVTSMFSFLVSGEQALFWSVSIGMVVMLLFLTLGIKETNPHSALLGQPFSFRSVFGGLFSQHLWPVYILAFSVAILGTGLGVFNLLLVTEQWGYTNQELGTNIFVGGIINLFLIPLLGLLSKKVGRGHVYVGLVIAGMVVNFSMYLYYNFVLYDARPTLIEMIVFGEMLSVIGILTAMALTPFEYDFIPRNELGTYAAGRGLVTKGTNMLTVYLMGLFVWGYATAFLGPPGEMVRVVLADEHRRPQVQSVLQNVTWQDPASGAKLAAPSLTAKPWYATGAALDHGRCYEVRLRNPESAAIREQRDWLDTERGKHKVRRVYAQNQLRTLSGAHPASTAPATSPAATPATRPATLLLPNVAQQADRLLKQLNADTDKRLAAAGKIKDKTARLTAQAAAEQAAEDALSSAIATYDAVLDGRAQAFESQVRQAMGQRMLQDGQQILAASIQPAVIASFALSSRPDSHGVERAIDRLHKLDPNVTDLRVVLENDKLYLQLSCAGSPDARHLRSLLQRAAASQLSKSMPWPPQSPTLIPAKALRLDLRIIEDPLDRHISPITRLVNTVTSIVVDPPTPERRLNALGRGLRQPGVFDHTAASPVPGDPSAIRLTALLNPAPATQPAEASAVKVSPAVQQRLSQLLDPASAASAVELYRAALPTAHEQRMTIAAPVLTASFAKQQYDYLAGYIATFLLQLVGLGITFFFLFMVRTGRVRRRGAEEAEAIA